MPWDRLEETTDHVGRKTHHVEGRFEEVFAFEEEVVHHPVEDIDVVVAVDDED